MKNISLFALGNIITLGVQFVMLPIYSRYLSVAEFGVVNSMQILRTFFLILLPLGLERSIYRVYYDYSTSEDKEKFVGSLLIGMLTIEVAILCLIFISRDFVSLLFPSISFVPYYLLTLISVLPVSIIQLSKALNQVEEDAKIYITQSVAQLLLSTVAIIYFLIYKGMGAYGYVLGLLVGPTVLVFPVLYYLLSKIKLLFSFYYFRPALLFSLPLLPMLLSSFALNLSDRFFIDNFFTQEDIGLYSLGYKMASLILLVGSSLYLAYTPVFYKLANQLPREDAVTKIRVHNDLYVGLVGLGTVGLFALCGPVIEWVFPSSYASAVIYCRWFCLVVFLTQITGLFNLMIYQAKNNKRLALVVFIAAVVNVLLNYFLLESWGPLGAVYTSLVSCLLMFVGNALLSVKSYYVPFAWNMTAKCILLMVLFASLRYLGIAEWTTIGICFVATIIIYGPGLLITVKKFKKIMA